ncbi:MAG: DUF4270 domain-containing protein [Bacteroidaceae bacterium]|nr:DUF4270 domain-containing protein [Bacteroidaceae bacterium]
MQYLYHHIGTLLLAFATLFVSTGLISCDDQTGTIGSGIMPDEDLTTTSQAIHNFTTSSLGVDSLIAFTSDCYLGRITDPETNSTTTSDFIAQFATLENDKLPDISAMIKENGQVVADSVIINLYIKSYYGDSVNPMKIGVYELDRNNILPEDKNYYTNIEPEEYVNKSNDALKKEISFTVTNLAIDDTIRSATSYSKNIRISLPSDYGTAILQKYYQHPEYFKNSYTFIRNVVPGFYFKTLAGNGTMVNIDVSTLTIFFKYQIEQDTIVGIKRIASTKEVIQCNNFQNRNLQPMLTENNCTYIKSPAAIFTEATLPINEIYKNHENDTINSAKIVFKRVNSLTNSQFILQAPQQLLMVRKSELETFFKDKDTPDNTTSYTTKFSQSYNSYTFSNIAGMVSYLHRLRNKEAGIKPTDDYNTILAKTKQWEANNPDWNKVVLVPITTNTDSYSNIINVFHDFSLSSTKLLGGINNPQQITVVYSRFK